MYHLQGLVSYELLDGGHDEHHGDPSVEGGEDSVLEMLRRGSAR